VSTIFVILLLLWLSPALLLAPLLVRACSKRDAGEQVSRAEMMSEEQIHSAADYQPEHARDAEQSKQASPA
jgi:hypothetical protein